VKKSSVLAFVCAFLDQHPRIFENQVPVEIGPRYFLITELDYFKVVPVYRSHFFDVWNLRRYGHNFDVPHGHVEIFFFFARVVRSIPFQFGGLQSFT
jgi:hypothetical protein